MIPFLMKPILQYTLGMLNCQYVFGIVSGSWKMSTDNLQILMVQDCNLLSWNLQLWEPNHEQNKACSPEGTMEKWRTTSTLRVAHALYNSSLRVSPKPSALPVKVVVTTWKNQPSTALIHKEALVYLYYTLEKLISSGKTCSSALYLSFW